MKRLLTLLILAISLTAYAENGELNHIRKTIRGFSAIDTAYIEPQHYNWSLMGQVTFNYDYYRLESESGQSVSFAPDIVTKVGPFFGWRWIFLGYTFDLKNIGFGGGGAKREFNFSIYSSQIGVDLFYRRTGSDYKIRSANLGNGVSNLDNVDFDGLKVGITGINAYYIFNHNRFSYPAAFAQSTIQKISCGSWMLGGGFTKHSLELDYDKLFDLVMERNPGVDIPDTKLEQYDVKYFDINVSVGYGYNWVFAKNWLFASSLSAALAYKSATTNLVSEESGYADMVNNRDNGFDIDNFNLDGILRLGLVYNNMDWYAGSSLIVHAYNYDQTRFATNNIFGNLNIYVGFNFGAKDGYKKKK